MSKGMQPKDFGELYDMFQANVSRYDCGRFCGPINGDSPVCCSTQHAVPVVEKPEWTLLKGRTDLWHRFKPYDATTRKIVNELGSSCCAIECKGARFCERDNRTLACRAFPFYPYITREGAFIGLGTYWIYEDRCWLISNMQVVERDFLKEFIAAYEFLFEKDPAEFETMKQHSATHRRTFTRLNRPIALIAREGGFLKVLPGGKGIVPLKREDLPRIGIYKSERAYARAVKAAGGTMPAQSVMAP